MILDFAARTIRLAQHSEDSSGAGAAKGRKKS